MNEYVLESNEQGIRRDVVYARESPAGLKPVRPLKRSVNNSCNLPVRILKSLPVAGEVLAKKPCYKNVPATDHRK